MTPLTATVEPETRPTWSPDGRFIAFQKHTNGQLDGHDRGAGRHGPPADRPRHEPGLGARRDARLGRPLRPLAAAPAVRRAAARPRRSRRPTRVVGRVRRGEAAAGGSPSRRPWRRRGCHVAGAWRAAATTRTSHRRPPTQPSPASRQRAVEQPATTGGVLAYSRDTADGEDVYVRDLAAGTERRLTSGRRGSSIPTSRQTAGWVAYRSNPDPASDAADIWVVGADGSAPRNLTGDPNGDNWAPAGRPTARCSPSRSQPRGGTLALWTMRARRLPTAPRDAGALRVRRLVAGRHAARVRGAGRRRRHLRPVGGGRRVGSHAAADGHARDGVRARSGRRTARASRSRPQRARRGSSRRWRPTAPAARGSRPARAPTRSGHRPATSPGTARAVTTVLDAGRASRARWATSRAGCRAGRRARPRRTARRRRAACRASPGRGSCSPCRAATSAGRRRRRGRCPARSSTTASSCGPGRGRRSPPGRCRRSRTGRRSSRSGPPAPDPVLRVEDRAAPLVAAARWRPGSKTLVAVVPSGAV